MEKRDATKNRACRCYALAAELHNRSTCSNKFTQPRLPGSTRAQLAAGCQLLPLVSSATTRAITPPSVRDVQLPNGCRSRIPLLSACAVATIVESSAANSMTSNSPLKTTSMLSCEARGVRSSAVATCISIELCVFCELKSPLILDSSALFVPHVDCCKNLCP